MQKSVGRGVGECMGQVWESVLQCGGGRERCGGWGEMCCGF